MESEKLITFLAIVIPVMDFIFPASGLSVDIMVINMIDMMMKIRW